MSRRGRRFIADERGVTLPELLISLSILGLLLPVVAGELSSVSRLWHGAADRLEARGQATALLRNLEGELREGRSFAVTPWRGAVYKCAWTSRPLLSVHERAARTRGRGHRHDGGRREALPLPVPLGSGRERCADAGGDPSWSYSDRP